ncbi:hypothetical protein TSUD_132650 [Trifolium subterraneum]|uniref:C2H2-type domain-containing protein n=1 Tax=Trifolium subterraneum TaxID=3900 RepID=A0A2Z6MDR7_TRISU|nr:hypothetical protein TSUD_132650 [Trifolium subterraneum]
MKRPRSSPSSDDEDHEDDDTKMMKKQEVLVQKSHECNICGKTFNNGKALGGHRRSHFIKKKGNPHHHQSPELKTPSKNIRIDNKSDCNGDDDDHDESDNISDKKLKTSEDLCESRVDEKPNNHSEEQKSFNFDLNEPYVMED